MSELKQKISVIIPCYNVEKLVSRCLESVLTQSVGLEHLEIILVDDASTDNTLEVLKSYEQRYPENIMIIACDTNGKQGTARNIALQYASGEYISFVDSDDVIHRDMYKILMEIAGATDSDIVQFRYICRNSIEEVNTEETLKDISYKEYDFSDFQKRRLLFIDDSILNQSCTTKFYKRELIEKAGVRFAEGMAYEEPLFTYPLKYYVNKVAVTETFLYYYISNKSGTINEYMADLSTIIQHPQVQLDTFNVMKSKPEFDECKREVEFYFMHTFYAETFYFLKYRNSTMPVALFRELAGILEENVPEYRQNPYINDPLLVSEKLLIDLIDKLKNMDDNMAQLILDNAMKIIN